VTPTSQTLGSMEGGHMLEHNFIQGLMEHAFCFQSMWLEHLEGRDWSKRAKTVASKPQNIQIPGYPQDTSDRWHMLFRATPQEQNVLPTLVGIATPSGSWGTGDEVGRISQSVCKLGGCCGVIAACMRFQPSVTENGWDGSRSSKRRVPRCVKQGMVNEAHAYARFCQFPETWGTMMMSRYTYPCELCKQRLIRMKHPPS
jgi:hypothetical protein